MAECVVVPLEAVEVEDHEQARLHARSLEQALEVGQEFPAIAEAGQRVGDRLPASQFEEPPVLTERDGESDDDCEQRGG